MLDAGEEFNWREEKRNWGKGPGLIIKQMCPSWKSCLQSAHSYSKIIVFSPLAHTFHSWLHILFFSLLEFENEICRYDIVL